MKLKIRHLYRRNLTYFFRIRMPSDLIRHFGRAEIHRTLGTDELDIAESKCNLLLEKFEKLFYTIRMEISKKKLSDAEIRALVSKELKQLLDSYEDFLATKGEISSESLAKAINKIEIGIDFLKDALAHNKLDFVFSKETAKELLKFHDYTEADLSKTAREILKMRIREFQTKLERLKGNYDNPYDIEDNLFKKEVIVSVAAPETIRTSDSAFCSKSLKQSSTPNADAWPASSLFSLNKAIRFRCRIPVISASCSAHSCLPSLSWVKTKQARPLGRLPSSFTSIPISVRLLIEAALHRLYCPARTALD